MVSYRNIKVRGDFRRIFDFGWEFFGENLINQLLTIDGWC
jgi:hypothetical protein